MPEKVDHRVKLNALTLVVAGHSKAQAACLIHISKSTVTHTKRKQHLYGDIEGGRQKNGRRPKFTPEIINVTHFLCLHRLTVVQDRSLNNYEAARLSTE